MTLAYLGDSGIVLLAGDEPFQYDEDGVRWQWNGSEPWSPGPAPRTVTGERAADHGSWDATQFYGPRSYPLNGLAHAPDHESLHRAKTRFMAACGLNIMFRCVEPGGLDRQARFRRDGEPLWAERSTHIAAFSVPLWAGDPRAYSTAARSATAGFPASAGGLVWPATWPATWDATTVSGEMQLTNAGTETAWPIYRLDGPITNPTITNPTTGQAMRLDLVLASGQWVTINTATHQVLADGDPDASRRSLFWGDWFGLAPGENTIRLGGDFAGAGAQLSATWHDTWI